MSSGWAEREESAAQLMKVAKNRIIIVFMVPGSEGKSIVKLRKSRE
jgi:hypothetical protein